MSPAQRREMMDRTQPSLSIVRLAGREPFQPLLLAQSCLGRGPVPDGRERPAILGDALLRVHTRMKAWPEWRGSRKRVQWLMRPMWL